MTLLLYPEVVTITKPLRPFRMKKILTLLLFSLFTVNAHSQCNVQLSIGQDTTVCNSDYQLVPFLANVSPPYTFQWFYGANVGPNTSSFTIGSCSNTMVVLFVTDGNGCQTADTAYVSVYRPQHDTLFLCGNPNAVLDLGPGGLTYDWLNYTDTNGAIQFLSNITQFQPSLGPGYYTAVANFPECGVLNSTIPVVSGCQGPITDCSTSFVYTAQFSCGQAHVDFLGAAQAEAPISWFWDFGDGQTSNSADFVSHNYAFPGTYHAILSTISATNCLSTYSVYITVPNSSSVEVFLPSDTVVCQNTLCVYPIISGGSGSGFTYQWSDGITDPIRCFEHEYDRQLSFTVTDIGTGCSATDTIVLSVFNPLINDTFYLCQNGEAFLDFGPGPPGTQYFWQSFTDTMGNMSSLSDTGQTYWATAAGQYFGYTYFPGCGALTSLINVLPCEASCDASFTFQSLPTACYDSSFFGVDTYVNGTNYTWNFGDGHIETNQEFYIQHLYYHQGIYQVSLTVSNSYCTNTSTQTITIGGNYLHVDIGSDTLVCNDYFSRNIVPQGGSAPYSFFWNLPGSSTGQTPPIPIGANQYLALLVTDANGCMDSDTAYISVARDTIVTIPPCQLPLQICAIMPDAVYYNWSTGANSQCTSPVLGSENNVNYGFAQAGCTSLFQVFEFLPCVNNDSVWPGDANKDGTVTNFDILNLGMIYNQTGPARTDQGNAWYAHAATWWPNFFNYGVNHNQADCNGDGVVNADDTLAVSQNYLLTHQKVESADSTLYPSLYVEAQSDTLGLNQSAVFKIMLGTSNLSLDSVYGISFTLTYSSLASQPGTASLDFSNSWLAPVGNQLSFQKANSGSIDVALTRIDHSNQNGWGEIANFVIVTTDNLSGITDLDVRIEDARALTHSAADILLSTQGDSTILVTGISELEALTKLVKMYPNPAKDWLKIESPVAVSTIELLDISGRMVLKSESCLLALEGLDAGSYQVKIKTDKGILMKKVVVQ
jgi:PKD repeat protein